MTPEELYETGEAFMALALAGEGDTELQKSLKNPLPNNERATAAHQFKALHADFRRYIMAELADADMHWQQLRQVVPPGALEQPGMEAFLDAHHKLQRRRMTPAIRTFYTRAFQLGLQAGGAGRGVSPNEENLVERMRRNEYAFLDDFLTDMKHREGKMDYEKRGALYGNALREVYWSGYVYADLSSDRMLKWRMTIAEHCFPAGTMIDVPGGRKPIESLRVGDLVETLAGPKRVTRLYENDFSGSLVHLSAGGQKVSCTPNHPFLTQRGWIEAGSIRPGDNAVLLKDGHEQVRTEFAFPNADDAPAAGLQVRVLRGVSLALCNLPLGQWLKARVAVPVVPVSLYNQVADPDVHDELRLDEVGRLVLDAHCVKHGSQALLQLTRLVSLQSLVALEQLFQCFGMALHLPLKPLFGSRQARRVVSPHVGSGLGVDQPMRSLFGDAQAKFVGFVPDAGMLHSEVFSDALRAVLCVMFPKVRDFLFAPTPNPAYAFGFGFDGPTRMYPTIATGGAAVQSVSLTRTTLERAAAVLASKLHGGSPPQSVYASEKKNIKVYNIEVEDVHHYVANGFVVHNCDDCAYMAGNASFLVDRGYDLAELEAYMGFPCGGRWGRGIYSAQELAQAHIFPQSGTLVCTTNCKCRLISWQRPKSEPEGHAISAPFKSIEPKDLPGERKRNWSLRKRKGYGKRAKRTVGRYHPRSEQRKPLSGGRKVRKTPPTVEDLKKSLQVKGHYRTVGGKRVWVPAYTSNRNPEQAAPQGDRRQAHLKTGKWDHSASTLECANGHCWPSVETAPTDTTYAHHSDAMCPECGEPWMRGKARDAEPGELEQHAAYRKDPNARFTTSGTSFLGPDHPEYQEPKGGRHAEQEAPTQQAGTSQGDVIRRYADRVRSNTHDYHGKAGVARLNRTTGLLDLYAELVDAEGPDALSRRADTIRATAEHATGAALTRLTDELRLLNTCAGLDAKGGGSGTLRKSVADGVADLIKSTVQGYWRTVRGKRHFVPEHTDTRRRADMEDPFNQRPKSTSKPIKKLSEMDDDELAEHETGVRTKYTAAQEALDHGAHPDLTGYMVHGGELERIADERGIRSGVHKREDHPNHDANSTTYRDRERMRSARR